MVGRGKTKLSSPTARKLSPDSTAPQRPSLLSVRPKPRLHLFPEPATSPGCSIASPGFKLNSFILSHIMSHQVPSSVESASPKPLPPTSPLFFCRTTYFSEPLPIWPQPLLPDSVSSSSASISLLCSKTLNDSILPKNVVRNISAWFPQRLVQASCSMLPYKYSMLQANNCLLLVAQSPLFGSALRAPRSLCRHHTPRGNFMRWNSHHTGFRVRSKLQHLPASRPWKHFSLYGFVMGK